MKPFLFICVCAGATVLVAASQQPPPTPQQPTDLRFVISGEPGLPPKLGIAGFIALSPDAETGAAAKTIADVLYDDIAYEREYFMIGKDAIATIPKPASLDQVPLDRWKEVNANGVIVGTIRKTSSGVAVQVKLIDVSSGKTAFGKEYSGSIANPRQYAHTISDEIHEAQRQVKGVARTRLTLRSTVV